MTVRDPFTGAKIGVMRDNCKERQMWIPMDSAGMGEIPEPRVIKTEKELIDHVLSLPDTPLADTFKNADGLWCERVSQEEFEAMLDGIEAANARLHTKAHQLISINMDLNTTIKMLREEVRKWEDIALQQQELIETRTGLMEHFREGLRKISQLDGSSASDDIQDAQEIACELIQLEK